MIQAEQSHTRGSLMAHQAGATLASVAAEERDSPSTVDLVRGSCKAIYYCSAQKTTAEPGTFQFLSMYTGHE